MVSQSSEAPPILTNTEAAARNGSDATASGRANQREESFGDKLFREAYVIGEGVRSGFASAAQDSLTSENRWHTALTIGTNVAIGLALSVAQSRAGMFRAGAQLIGTAMGVSFVNDMLDQNRLGNIGRALSGTWQSEGNTAQSVSLIRDNAGRFAFDTALGAVSGGVGMTAGHFSMNRWSAPREMAPASTPTSTSWRRDLEPSARNMVLEQAEPVSGSRLERDTPGPLERVAAAPPRLLEQQFVRELGEALAPRFQAIDAANLRPSLREMQASRRQLDGMRETASMAIEMPLAERGITMELHRMDDAPYMRALLADHPQLLRTYEKYERDGAPFREKMRKFDEAMEPHLRLIEGDLNQALNARGIPGLTLRSGPNTELPGMADYTAHLARARVHEEALTSRVWARTADSIVHESTHHEQHVLTIHAILDHLNVGRTISARQLKQVDALAFERTGTTMPRETIQELVRLRQGQHLSAEQAARAQQLSDSFRDMIPARRHDVEERYGRLQRVVDDAIRKGPGSVLDNWANYPDFLKPAMWRQHFGVTEPPPAVASLLEQRAKFRDGHGTWDELAATDILTDAVGEHIARLDTARTEQLAAYRAQLHEAEARQVGGMAREEFRARGFADRRQLTAEEMLLRALTDL